MELRSSPTQTTSFQPPISKLTDEILWFIFLINTEGSTAPFPLVTARKSSQVCRRWRSILLNAPSIWGRLMDWRALNQTSDAWRSETLRRSGLSVLWVTPPNVPLNTRRGCSFRHTMKTNTSTLLFFQKLIAENWERIEMLSPFVINGKINIDIQALVQRRAPNLQVFTLPHLCMDGAEYHGELFLNHAPRLHNFRARTHCKLDIRWMSNLRTLNLSGKFSNQEVCKVLARMPYLESLTLQGNENMQVYSSPPIHLPLLHTLVLRHCLIYLRNLDASPTTLILSGSETIDQESYGNCIASSLHDYLSKVQPKFTRLRLDPDRFTIGDQPYLLPNSQEDGYLEISVSRLSTSYGNRLERTMDILASPRFSTITTLRIQCGELKNRSRSCHHSFQQFLEHFSAVDTLQIHERDINILMQYVMTNTDTKFLFPLLKCLVMTGFDFSKVFDQGFKYEHGPASGSIEQFVDLRKRLGIPIQILTLDLTTSRPGKSIPPPARSLDPSLEHLVGLKVVWRWDQRIINYECGSGHPEHLQVKVDDPLVSGIMEGV
ncbi:hypothetical protein JR316_0009740 [Psilocybe cubensis]|uniref:Uncharacterized protein n=2 Tax=Psilocybe cubensis TaxID=181762 RepID=A0ACB8GP52_PSICU|nr:hypothetical protein JR316_0009740 [Psilocybe cubensis]KAH9477520.1 hypothetical protein JR316_0009740 [Psilocybe cubensis]